MSRIKTAFWIAARPGLATLAICMLIAVGRWSQLSEDWRAGVGALGTMVLGVFLTYFVLALIGYKASPDGAVTVPRTYAWLLTSAIFVVVFFAVFYLLFDVFR
jgi:hypothetical protein